MKSNKTIIVGILLTFMSGMASADWVQHTRDDIPADWEVISLNTVRVVMHKIVCSYIKP